jgi:hypothetical protein
MTDFFYVPIEVMIRTQNIDGQISDKKFFDEATLISDREDCIAIIRYSDDDYTTWSTFLVLKLNLLAKRVRRLGTAYRRAFEFRHYANTPFRSEGLDINIEKGVQ